MPKITSFGRDMSTQGIERLGFDSNHRRDTALFPPPIASGQIPDLGWGQEKIEYINVSALLAGTITSQSITMAVLADGGDVKIQAGKTDFSDTTNGFIIGIDDSDSDKVKFSIGDASSGMDWNETTLNTLTISNATITGTLIAGQIHIPDQDTTANSFHTSTVGDSWWGATETNFNADNDNANAYILSTGVAKFQSLTVVGGVIDGTSTLGGRTGTALAAAIDAATNLVTDLINARLNTSAKTILSDFTFGAADYAGGIATGDITWNTTTGALTGGSGVAILRSGILGAVAGVATFTIDGTTGAATFAGALSAPTGNIGGWIISPADLKDVAGLVGMSSAVTGGDDIRFFAGNVTPASAPFYVTESGALVASSATITGAITATSGDLGGWLVTSGYIYNLQSGTPTSAPNDGIVLASENEALIVYENTEKRAEVGYLSAGVYGLKAYAADGTTAIFEASDTQQFLGGWTFDNTALYNLVSGTPSSSPTDGLVLIANSTPAIIAYEDAAKRVELGYISAGVFGLKGYATDGSTPIFELSDTQQMVAGFFFTQNTMATNATTSLANVLIDAGNSLIRLGPTAGDTITLDGANLRLRTSNYVSGALGAGFTLEPDLLEVGNASIRGKMQMATFVANSISAVNGDIAITPGSDVLDTDMTAADASTVVLSGDMTLINGDIIRIKEGVDDEWMTVTNAAGAPTYVVTRDAASAYGADSNPAWTKGATVVNFGQTGAGGLFLTANDTNAPFLSVFTQAGSPWSALTTRVRVGNLNGYLGYVADTFGLGVGSSTAGEANITIDPTNGLRIRSGTTNLFAVDMSGGAAIAGWAITSDSIKDTAGVVGMLSTVTGGDDIRFFAGDATPASAEFRVYESGALVASSATITGAITATSGALGGWVVTTDAIKDAAGTVGMLSTVTGGDDIRFFAGNATPASAPFNVTEAGVLTSTSALIGTWTVGATTITGTGVTLSGTSDAYIAFGTTPPTAPTVGTGIFINKTGLFGLNANTQNFTISAATGIITATGAVIDGTSTLGGRTGTALATAINASNNLVTDLINARLDTSAKTILSDFTFGAVNYAGGIATGDIVWNTTTGALVSGSGIAVLRSGIIGAASGVATFTIDGATGAATFAGALSAPTGNFGGFTLSATTFTATNLTFTSGAANTANIAVGTGANLAGMNSGNAGTDIAFWAGATFANRATAPFQVNLQGDITATSATISGGLKTVESVTAGEDLEAGDFVAVESDGDVNAVRPIGSYTAGSPTTIGTSHYPGNYYRKAYQLSETLKATFTQDDGASAGVFYRLFTVTPSTGAVVSVGSFTQIPTGGVAAEQWDMCLLDATTALVIYQYNSAGRKIRGRVIQNIDTASPTVGAEQTLVTPRNAANVGCGVAAFSSTRAVLVYQNVGVTEVESIPLTISGTTVTPGTLQTFFADTNNIEVHRLEFFPGSTDYYCISYIDSTSGQGHIRVAQWNNTSGIFSSIGAETNVSNATYSIDMRGCSSTGLVLQHNASGNVVPYLSAVSRSGTTPTVSSALALTGASGVVSGRHNLEMLAPSDSIGATRHGVAASGDATSNPGTISNLTLFEISRDFDAVTALGSNIALTTAYKHPTSFLSSRKTIVSSVRSISADDAYHASSFADNVLGGIGVVNANAESAASASIVIAGKQSNFTGLTPGTLYYYCYSGNLTVEDDSTWREAGVAKSSTELIIR